MVNLEIVVTMGYVSAGTKNPVQDPQTLALVAHVFVGEVTRVGYQPATVVKKVNVFVELVTHAIKIVSRQGVWIKIYKFQHHLIKEQHVR